MMKAHRQPMLSASKPPRARNRYSSQLLSHMQVAQVGQGVRTCSSRCARCVGQVHIALPSASFPQAYDIAHDNAKTDRNRCASDSRESSRSDQFSHGACKSAEGRADAKHQEAKEEAFFAAKNIRQPAVQWLECGEGEEVARRNPGRGGEGVEFGADCAVRRDDERLVRCYEEDLPISLVSPCSREDWEEGRDCLRLLPWRGIRISSASSPRACLGSPLCLHGLPVAQHLLLCPHRQREVLFLLGQRHCSAR